MHGLALTLFSVGIGSMLLGCDSPPHGIDSGSTGGRANLSTTGGVPSTGGTRCDWGDADVPEEVSAVSNDAGTSDQPPGTCPLLTPETPLHFSSETDSPCPSPAPSIVQSRPCARSALSTRCVYPSTLSRNVEDIWTCREEGGTLDSSGNVVPGSTLTNWEYDMRVCKRTGGDCRIGLDEVCGRTSPRIELATPCQDRTLASCTAWPDETAQTNLDRTIGIPSSCVDGSSYFGQSALSVWFKGDCPSSFIVFPPEVADCVKAYLETVRFDCAAGLFCGASGMTGGCAC